jgi:hypothetical protein
VLPDEVDRLLPGLADRQHVELPVAFEVRADGHPDERMIVGDHDLDQRVSFP